MAQFAPVISLTTLLVLPLLAASPGAAQQDSIPLRDITKVRVLAPRLGTGWHEGGLVTVHLSGDGAQMGSCLSFAPTELTMLGAMSLPLADSVEVWMPAPSPADSSAARGEWVALPRWQIAAIGASCRGPGRD